MDLLNQTKYLIKKTGLKPNKLRGQNFCVDESVIQKMIEVAGIDSQDTVLEVGPGFGFLTMELLKKAKKVIAVELDIVLADQLKKMMAVNKNFEIIQEDVLKLKIEDLRSKIYTIVANLPYSITSAFLKKFLTAEVKPKSITVLVQKEVAERICAKSGQMSMLNISVQLYGQPKIIGLVPASSFWPEPKVESAILQINDIKGFPFSKKVSEKVFWQTVRSGFCAKRKMLKNNLANSLHLSPEKVAQALNQAKISPIARAQELKIEEWAELSCYIKRWL